MLPCTNTDHSTYRRSSIRKNQDHRSVRLNLGVSVLCGNVLPLGELLLQLGDLALQLRHVLELALPAVTSGQGVPGALVGDLVLRVECNVRQGTLAAARLDARD